MVMNSLHWPNTSNIHTHGLHIDPEVDTVLLKVHPGDSHTYHYVIPDNHSSGLNWYHTHSHGSSALGVMGGQHGALIVAPLASNPENLPASYLAATKTLMVLSHVQFYQITVTANGVTQISQGCSNGGGCSVAQGCAAGTTESPFAPFRSYSYIELGNEMLNQMSPNPNYYNSTAPDVYLVNGQMTPSITMSVGEYRVIQMVHAGGAYFLEFQQGQICTWQVIAIDGIYLKEVRTPSSSKFLMQQAGRYELLFTCTQTGTQVFKMLAGAPPHSQDLFTITVTSGTTGSHTAITTAQMAAIIRPDYLQDLYTLPSSAIQSTFELEFSQGGRQLPVCGFWLGSGDSCSKIWKGENPTDTIPGNTCPFQQFVSSRCVTGWEGCTVAAALVVQLC